MADANTEELKPKGSKKERKKRQQRELQHLRSVNLHRFLHLCLHLHSQHYISRVIPTSINVLENTNKSMQPIDTGKRDHLTPLTFVIIRNFSIQENKKKINAKL